MSDWMTEGASSIYSMSFVSAPPDGAFIRSWSYVSISGDACSLYRNEIQLQGRSTRDDWRLQLQTSDNTAGVFPIDVSNRVGSEPSAQVLVVHMVNAVEIERHTALSGALEVTSSPTTAEEQNAGMTFVVQGDIEFSTNEASNRAGCEAYAGDNGTRVTCHCRGADGDEFTCEAQNGTDNCCIDAAAPRTTFHIALRGTPCGQLCAVTDLTLVKYCTELGAEQQGL